MNDCSTCDGMAWPLNGPPAELPPPPPNVDCTKFVGLLNSLVKLLVLNDNNPFELADDDDLPDKSAPLSAPFISAESDLMRTDLVF